MRISDWSSDVCSSDLAQHLGNAAHAHAADADEVHARVAPGEVVRSRHVAGIEHPADHAMRPMVGSARWRRRLVPRAIAGLAVVGAGCAVTGALRSEAPTSELQSLMRTSYAVFRL